MVATNTHAFINLWIFNKLFKVNIRLSPYLYSIVFGAIAPDLSMGFFILYHIDQLFSRKLWDDIYFRDSWSTVFNYNHSIPLALLCCVLCYAIYMFLIKHYIPRKVNVVRLESPETGKTMELAVHGATMPRASSVNVSYDGNRSHDIGVSTSFADIDEEESRDRHQSIDALTNDINCRTCWKRNGICCLQDSNEMSAFTSIDITIFWFSAMYMFASMVLHNLLDLPVHHDDAHAHFEPITSWKFESPISYWDPDHYGYIVSPIESILSIAAAIWFLKLKWTDWKHHSHCCILWFWIITVFFHCLWAFGGLVWSLIWLFTL